MSHSVSLLVLLAVCLLSVVSAAPAFDDYLLPSDAEVSQLIKRAASFSGRAVLRQAATQAACEAKCFQDKYYSGMPTGGYDKDAACRAMKASYQCTVDAAGCVDADTSTKYKGYITGYEFWCPK